MLLLDALNQPSASGLTAMLARTRWYWLPPLYICLLLIVFAVTNTRGADAAQFMYRNF